MSDGAVAVSVSFDRRMAARCSREYFISNGLAESRYRTGHSVTFWKFKIFNESRLCGDVALTSRFTLFQIGSRGVLIWCAASQKLRVLNFRFGAHRQICNTLSTAQTRLVKISTSSRGALSIG